MEQVKREDALEFCRRLSDLPAERAAGHAYRLPTEAEWEYACRAGTTTAFSFGDDVSKYGDFAWVVNNSQRTSHPVGQKLANAFGLHDMHGNVFEWCHDWHSDFSNGEVTDPQGLSAGTARVLRGGSWRFDSGLARSAFRNAVHPDTHDFNVGFRIVSEFAIVVKVSAESTSGVSNVMPQPRAAIAPFDAVQAKVHQKEWADYLRVPVVSTNSIGMKLVLIPPGEFMMGSPASEPGRQPQGTGDETQHSVMLAMPFWIGVHEVTQSQYKKVMNSNPSEVKGPDNPVEMVSWKNAVKFCRVLSEMPDEKAAGSVYRLPTEAEWEYACRAGTTTAYNFGDQPSLLAEHEWFKDNSSGATQPVGQKQANAFGLKDMHGNVAEWCQEFDRATFSNDVTVRPKTISGVKTVFRGGSWGTLAANCRTAEHNLDPPPWTDSVYVGFRVLREPPISQ